MAVYVRKVVASEILLWSIRGLMNVFAAFKVKQGGTRVDFEILGPLGILVCCLLSCLPIVYFCI